jgi:ribonucleotide monophosphatase NagD (HAD superfamily)
LDKSCQAVVCGWDRHMNFSKAALASLQIQNGCKFFVTNPDKYTMIGGFRIPGNGAIYSMIEKGSGVSPEIMGKPNTFIIDNIIQ